MTQNTPRTIALFLALMLALAAAAGCGMLPSKRGPELSYRLTVPSDPFQPILVDCEIRGIEPGPLDLVMHRALSSAQTMAACPSLQITDHKAEHLPATIGSGAQGNDTIHWIVDIPASGKLSFSYMVPVTRDDSASPNPRDTHISTRLAHDHAYVEACELLVYPVAWQNAPTNPLPATVRVRVEAPQGWAVRANWSAKSDDGFYLPDTWQHLVNGVITAGHYALYDHEIGTFHARFCVSPEISPFAADRSIAAWAQQAAELYRFFGTPPSGKADEGMSLFVVVLADETPAAATRPDHTLVVMGDRDLTTRVDGVFARGVINLWLGDAVRFESTRGNALDALWIEEGWSEHLRNAIPLASGTLSPLQYWTRHRELVTAEGANPLAGLSLYEAAVRAPGEPAAIELMRQRGALGALLLDARLRQASDGTLDMAHACANLVQSHNTYRGGEPLTEAEAVVALGRMVGIDLETEYHAITQEAGSLNLSAVPELAGPPVGVARSVLAPDKVRVYYQWFDGPTERPGIYVPGGPGLPPYDAMYLTSEPLADVLDIAFMEPRGSGRSDHPGAAHYGLDAMVNDIDVVREALGNHRVTLLGHGFGGYCALTYARRYPERIDALVLLAPNPSFPRVVQAEMAALEKLIDENDADLAYRLFRLRERGVLSFNDFMALERLLVDSGAYGSDLAMVKDSIRAAYHHYVDKAVLPPNLALSNGDILPLLVGRDALLERDLLDEMPTAGFSALVLRGERDHVIPAEIVSELSETIGARVVTLPDNGHYFYLENPGHTTAEITAFIDSIPY